MAAPNQKVADKTTKDHIAGIVMSLGVHLIIVTSVVVGTITGAAALEKETEKEMAPFTPVELVRLGDPDSPSLELPNPAPREEKDEPKPKKVEVKPKVEEPDPDTVVLNRPDKSPDKKDRPDKRTEKKKPAALDIMKNFEHDPTRPVNENVPKGHKEGLADGTALVATERNLWVTRVQAAVRRRWRVPPTIKGDEARKLAGKVSVSIRVSPEGYIISHNIRGSGDPVFDGSVRRAVIAFTVRGGAKLPMPNDEVLRRQVTKGGLVLRNWKYTGQ